MARTEVQEIGGVVEGDLVKRGADGCQAAMPEPLQGPPTHVQLLLFGPVTMFSQ